MVTLHQCPFPGCGKKFDRKYNLKCHRRIHSDEKPYLCSHDQCSRAFRWKSSLNHHLMSLDHLSPKERLARKSAKVARRRPSRRRLSRVDDSIAQHLSELQIIATPTPLPARPRTQSELFVRGALAELPFSLPPLTSPPSLSSLSSDDDLMLETPDLAPPTDPAHLFVNQKHEALFKQEPSLFAPPKPELPTLFAPDAHALDVLMLSDALADAGAEHALSIY